MSSQLGNGWNGWEVVIIARKIEGVGKIVADWWDWAIWGKGGKITIISDDINWPQWELSAKAGRSLLAQEKWWENSWVQWIALVSAVVWIISFFIFLLS